MSLLWRRRGDLHKDQIGAIEGLAPEGRFLLVGPPGSGKTSILLHRGLYLRLPPQQLANVRLITFARTLREFIALDGNDRFPANLILTVKAFVDDVFKAHGGTPPAFDDSVPLPEQNRARAEQALALVAKVGVRLRFDALLVDEIQDLASEEVNLICQLSQRLMMVGDNRQKIYNVGGGMEAAKAAGCQEIELKHHFRLSPQICGIADKILVQGDYALAEYCHYQGPNPSPPTPKGSLSRERQIAELVAALDLQLDTYNDPADLLGVVVAHKDDCDLLFKELNRVGKFSGKCRIFHSGIKNRRFDGACKICIVTIQSCKGLEFRAVHWLFVDEAPYLTHERAYTVVRERDVLVFWMGNSVRPSAIAIRDSDRQELFAWLYTFHRDLTPLTSWCNLISPEEADRTAGEVRYEVGLSGSEAAWASAAITEAMALSGRSFDTIGLAPCLATEAFAIGRVAAIHGARLGSEQTSELFDATKRLLNRPTGITRRAATRSIAEVLLQLLPDAPQAGSGFTQACAHICRGLASRQSSETDLPLDRDLFRFLPLPFEVNDVLSLESLSAEDRVRFLRQIRPKVLSASADERQVLTFVAGYVLSRIGGAERDLRLAEAFEDAYADVLGWAAVLGSMGVRAYWTDAFEGLGRLVARELVRPFSLHDYPHCDISYDELLFVTAAQTSSKAHFRTANRNGAAVALKPGVVVQFSNVDDDRPRSRGADIARGVDMPADQENKNLYTLANQLFPYLRPLIAEEFERPFERKSKKGSYKLPLKG